MPKPDQSGCKRKQKRKSIMLSTKFDIITKHRDGMAVKDLAAQFGLNASTVCTILKDKDKYLWEAKNSGCWSATSTRRRDTRSLIPEMEGLLSAWIEQHQGHLTYAMVGAHALALFNRLKARVPGWTEQFAASRGWYQRYRKRASRHALQNTNDDLHPSKTVFLTKLEHVDRTIEQEDIDFHSFPQHSTDSDTIQKFEEVIIPEDYKIQTFQDPQVDFDPTKVVFPKQLDDINFPSHIEEETSLSNVTDQFETETEINNSDIVEGSKMVPRNFTEMRNRTESSTKNTFPQQFSIDDYRTLAELDSDESSLDFEPTKSFPSSNKRSSRGKLLGRTSKIAKPSTRPFQNVVNEQRTGTSFPQHIQNLIEEEEYTPSQMFSVNETGLFWKRLPTASGSEEAGIPSSNDRVTLLLAGNALGDFKMKPLMVHRVENPRPLQGIVKASLPVIWKANARASITAVIFEDWFIQHFIPEAKRYCTRKRISFHILLFVEAANHSTGLEYYHPDIRLICTPASTSFLQPRGVLAVFKAHYLRIIFDLLTEATDGAFLDVWSQFNILDAIKTVHQAWEEMTNKDLKSVWQKRPPNIDAFEDVETVVDEEINTIVDMATQLKLPVCKKDVADLLHAEKEVELAECGDEDATPERPINSFTLDGLKAAFDHIDQAINIFATQDSNLNRRSMVTSSLRDSYACYRDIYDAINRLTLQPHDEHPTTI